MAATLQLQVLGNARALIADPANWTSHTPARAADGRPAAWYGRHAVQWCALGAIYRAAYDLIGSEKPAERIGKKVAALVYPPRFWFLKRSLPYMNDAYGHAAILRAFDKALLGLGGG
jgi:hypothetical protein